jgi:predicted  nucleic acid-binding Zn-ribbon protein
MSVDPKIAALHRLQQEDRRVVAIDRKLVAIPRRIKELDEDLAGLEAMLATEAKKVEDSRSFKHSHESQLADEEEMLRQSRARLSAVKNTREMQAVQRELDATRKMAVARGDEIAKLEKAITEAAGRLTVMQAQLDELRTKETEEKARLVAEQTRLTALRESTAKRRSKLIGDVPTDLYRTYDRIRTKSGGIGFVAAHREHCTACRTKVPSQVYVLLRRGDEIPECEHCGRLLYWSGHFPEEADKLTAAATAKVKAAPAPRAAGE